MRLIFGFELEGFHRQDGVVALPPNNYPTDGFPGLCEVRTTGGKSMEDAYFELLQQYHKYPFDHQLFEHTYTPAEKRELRARDNRKDALMIGNIYGKEPRALGNRTIASLQVNMSYQIPDQPCLYPWREKLACAVRHVRLPSDYRTSG
jgi:hypothetical protein